MTFIAFSKLSHLNGSENDLYRTHSLQIEQQIKLSDCHWCFLPFKPVAAPVVELTQFELLPLFLMKCHPKVCYLLYFEFQIGLKFDFN